MVPSIGNPRTEQERQYHESLVIILDTLEKCLVHQPNDKTKYEETMNVKILLREICQFIGEHDCLFFFFLFFSVSTLHDYRCYLFFFFFFLTSYELSLPIYRRDK